MQSPNFPTVPSTAASLQSAPVQSYPPPQYSVATGLFSFSLAIVVTTGLFWLALRREKKSDPTIVLLQQQVNLERIYRTHYWLQDYRTQDESEDYRSATLRQRSEQGQSQRSRTPKSSSDSLR